MARLMLLLFAVASMIAVSRAGTFQKSSAPNYYSLKISKDGYVFDEQVSVDIKKGTETFHLREANSGKDAGDIIYDLKRNLTMIRVPEAKACFLSESTKDIPRPSDLLQLLKLLTGKPSVQITPKTEVKLKVDGTLKDRTILSKKMQEVCAKLPVYRVTEGDVDLKKMKQKNDAEKDSDLAQVPAQRAKRNVWKHICKTVCTISCYTKCSGWVCYPVCRPVCRKVCSWVFGG